MAPLESGEREIIMLRAAERGAGGGGQIAPGPQVLGAPRNFLLGPSHFLGEIFPRKGQDIWFFEQSTEIWYEVKLLESNYNVLVVVRKNVFPEKNLK
jgi:hypothetical protein